MHIIVKYFRLPNKARRGLSETTIKQKLERQGWIVWRGGLIHISRKQNLYPNVQKKYALLSRLLTKHHPRILPVLQYLCHVHHGMPDFLCYNTRFKFVECKLGYESLSTRQKKCIPTLLRLGFPVEIHRLAAPGTKTRTALLDCTTWKIRQLSKQHKLHM